MLKIRMKKICEQFIYYNDISRTRDYIKNRDVAEFILANSLNFLEAEKLLILYEYVSNESKIKILSILQKKNDEFTAPFGLILKQINLESSEDRKSILIKELFKTRRFGEIYNYLLCNPQMEDGFRNKLINDLSYALDAIYYLNRNNLKGFVNNIDAYYIEKLIIKDKNVKVLENYISNYKIHDNKDIEKILFELCNAKLIYLYVLKGDYSEEFNVDKAIKFIEASGDLELVIRTAIYLKPENLSDLNADDFFLGVGLIDLPEHEKKKLIDDAYELFSAKRAEEFKETIVLDSQKRLKDKFVGKNLHN